MDIQTARGPIAPHELGFTLPHEHIHIDLMRDYRGQGLLNERALMIEEVQLFKESGGGTIVEVTNIGLGRDPQAMREISEATGVHILVATGHYRDPYINKLWMDWHSVDQVAELIIRDLEEGIVGCDSTGPQEAQLGDTGIRAGIIGELGTDRWYISSAEERSFRAAARAHLRTGAAITTHAARWPVGTAQLDLLAEEGVDPRRVIIGHCDSVPLHDYHLELARRGAYVQFDMLAYRPSPWDQRQRVDWIRSLVEQGYIDRILLSHDVSLRDTLATFGGGGYSYLAEKFVPQLLEAGLSSEQVDRITVTNPREALTGEAES